MIKLMLVFAAAAGLLNSAFALFGMSVGWMLQLG